MTANRVLVDTSAWLSFILSNDRSHEQIDAKIKELYADRAIIYTTNDIVDETVTRLVYDKNLLIAKKFISLLDEGIKERTIIQLWTDEVIQREAFLILTKFSDHELSLTDATSAVIFGRYNIDAILTLDSDFVKIGLSCLP